MEGLEECWRRAGNSNPLIAPFGHAVPGDDIGWDHVCHTRLGTECHLTQVTFGSQPGNVTYGAIGGSELSDANPPPALLNSSSNHLPNFLQLSSNPPPTLL